MMISNGEFSVSVPQKKQCDLYKLPVLIGEGIWNKLQNILRIPHYMNNYTHVDLHLYFFCLHSDA
jgi:hypothetical protein